MAASEQNREYIALNRENWNERAETHAQSKMYNVEAFVADPNYISNIVRYDKPLLPSVAGKSVIHLQGHIGTDSLSLARLGAESVTILDFSSESLAQARRLADRCKDSGGSKLRFVEANVYDAADPALYAADAPKPGEFDVVFAGVGSLCWIHSITKWAEVVSKMLKPGGTLFVRDDHPVLFAMDDDPNIKPDGRTDLALAYSYFEEDSYAVIEDNRTYADTQGEIGELTATKTVQFNHGLGETVQALIDSGLRITKLKEHLEVPFDALPGRMDVVDVGTGPTEWRIKEKPERCPHTFTIVAVKE